MAVVRKDVLAQDAHPLALVSQLYARADRDGTSVSFAARAAMKARGRFAARRRLKQPRAVATSFAASAVTEFAIDRRTIDQWIARRTTSRPRSTQS
jgi:hypothetical protein